MFALESIMLYNTCSFFLFDIWYLINIRYFLLFLRGMILIVLLHVPFFQVIIFNVISLFYIFLHYVSWIKVVLLLLFMFMHRVYIYTIMKDYI